MVKNGNSVNFQVKYTSFFQMKKCRDVTVGYTTENKCEEWPVQNCTIEKVTVKNTAPNSKCERNTMEVISFCKWFIHATFFASGLRA